MWGASYGTLNRVKAKKSVMITFFDMYIVIKQMVITFLIQ